MRCVNLRTLVVELQSREGDNTMELDKVVDAFNALRNDGVIRERVSSFTLRTLVVSFKKLKNASFLNFFAVFPNIKELDLMFPDLDCAESQNHFSTISADVTSKTEFTFASIQNALSKISHQLEKLSLFVGHWRNESNDIGIARSSNVVAGMKMEKLKRLSLMWPVAWDASTTNPLLPLRHVTDLSCTLGNTIGEHFNYPGFVQHVLNTCTNLYSLGIYHPDRNSFVLTKDCFKTLVRSQLRTFSIDFNLQIDFEPSSLENHIQPNHTLKSYEYYECSFIVNLLFTRYFRGLEKLIICAYDCNTDDIDTGILSNIFRYQTKLLHLAFETSEFPFSSLTVLKLAEWLQNEDQLPRQLDNLTHLCFLNCEPPELPQFLLTEFKFPKLKAFSMKEKLSYDTNYKYRNLFWAGLQQCTQLEYLEIRRWTNGISFEGVSDLCSALPKLRYCLFDTDSKPFEKKNFHQLFQNNPSLRAIVHLVRKDLERFSVKYFRELGTNTVRDVGWPSESKRYYFFYDGIPKKYTLYDLNYDWLVSIYPTIPIV